MLNGLCQVERVAEIEAFAEIEAEKEVFVALFERRVDVFGAVVWRQIEMRDFVNGIDAIASDDAGRTAARDEH